MRCFQSCSISPAVGGQGCCEVRSARATQVIARINRSPPSLLFRSFCALRQLRRAFKLHSYNSVSCFPCSVRCGRKPSQKPCCQITSCCVTLSCWKAWAIFRRLMVCLSSLCPRSKRHEFLFCFESIKKKKKVQKEYGTVPLVSFFSLLAKEIRDSEVLPQQVCRQSRHTACLMATTYQTR